MSLLHGHSSDSGQPKLLQMEGRVISVGTKLGMHSGCAKISHLDCSSNARLQVAVCRHAMSYLLWRDFLTFPSSISPSPCTSIISLWNCIGWTSLVFKNCITNHNSQGDFRFLCSSFDYSNSKKKSWHHTMQYTCSPWHAVDEWPTHEVHASHAQMLCAISCYILDVNG